MQPQMNADLMKGLFDKGGANPIILARRLIEGAGGAGKELLDTVLGQVDLVLAGPELLQCAAKAGQADVVAMLLEKGVDVMHPPEICQGDDTYRRCSYVIQAACSGNMPTVMKVLDAGARITDAGVFTLSKQKKNEVISNAIGAAAFNGRHQVMEYFIDKLDKSSVELEALEQADTKAKKKATYSPEFAGYTPLMLAVAGTDANIECVKTLLKHKANQKAIDKNGNTLLHIAAINGNNKILDYLGKNLDMDIFARNKKGDTALTICQNMKNIEGTGFLQKFQVEYDKSSSVADQLFAELNAEEKKAEEATAKKAAKRHRNKVNKIAKAEGKTVEQVEQELKEQEEKRIRDEQQEKENEKQREIEADKQKKLDAKRIKEETKKLQEQLRIAEEEEQRERYRQKLDMDRQRKQKQQDDEIENQRLRQERITQQRQERQARQEARAAKDDQSGAQKERPKSTRRAPVETPTPTPGETEEVKATEERVSRHEAKPGAQRATSRAANQRKNSKSVRRDGQTEEGATLGGDDKFNVAADGTIHGLTGDIAAGAVGKRAKKSMAQKKKEEEEEAARTKQRMIDLAKERAQNKIDAIEEAKRAIEEEKRQKKRDAENRRKAAKKEREAKEAADAAKAAPVAAAATPKGEADAASAKDSEAKSSKKGGEKKEKPEKKERAKTARQAAKPEDENTAPKDEKVEAESNATDAKKKKGNKKAADKEEKAKPEYRAKGPAPVQEESKEVTPAAPLEEKSTNEEKPANAKPKKQRNQKKAEKTAEPGAEAVKVTPGAPEEPKAVPAEAPIAAVEVAPKQAPAPKKEAKKAKPASVSNLSESEEIDRLRQLILQKESAVLRLEAHLEKKDRTISEKSQQVTELKQQLASDAKGDELKQKVGQLQDGIQKQMALNRLQAAQIIELEESLWRANKAQDDSVPPSAPDGPAEDQNAALEKARTDVRIKHVQVRDLQGKVDQYQGKAAALAFMGKGQLSELQDELQSALANVGLAMSTADQKTK